MDGDNKSYLQLLNDELEDAYRRLSGATEEGIPVIQEQIREIERDIGKYSKKH